MKSVLSKTVAQRRKITDTENLCAHLLCFLRLVIATCATEQKERVKTLAVGSHFFAREERGLSGILGNGITPHYTSPMIALSLLQ